MKKSLLNFDEIHILNQMKNAIYSIWQNVYSGRIVFDSLKT